MCAKPKDKQQERFTVTKRAVAGSIFSYSLTPAPIYKTYHIVYANTQQKQTGSKVTHNSLTNGWFNF